MNKAPRMPVHGRRSAGMLDSPRGRRTGPAISAAPPERPAAAPPLKPTGVSRHPQPQVLMGEVASPRGRQVGEYRDAFRAFMIAHRLRPHAWAKKADVPLGEIMAYLSGHQRFLGPGVAERLATAAGVPPQKMFE